MVVFLRPTGRANQRFSANCPARSLNVMVTKLQDPLLDSLVNLLTIKKGENFQYNFNFFESKAISLSKWQSDYTKVQKVEYGMLLVTKGITFNNSLRYVSKARTGI